VILLADSIRSRLLSWFGSLIIKKIPEYHPPNVYGYVEMWMYIMSKHCTIPNCSKCDFRNDDRYKDILLSLNCSQAFITQSVRRRIFYPDLRRSYPVTSAPEFFAFFLFFFFFLYIQMFFYTIMERFITLLQNVNKSRTSAGRLSLTSLVLSLQTSETASCTGASDSLTWSVLLHSISWWHIAAKCTCLNHVLKTRVIRKLVEFFPKTINPFHGSFCLRMWSSIYKLHDVLTRYWAPCFWHVLQTHA
jgi:hypothetical protein